MLPSGATVRQRSATDFPSLKIMRNDLSHHKQQLS